MKTILLIVLFIFILCFDVFALPSQITYKGTTIKYYSDDINQTECQSELDKIPDKYFDKLRSISFFDFTNGDYLGYYFYGKRTIHVYGYCELWVIVHELAHHQQYVNDDSVYNMRYHVGMFDDYEDEIWANIE